MTTVTQLGVYNSSLLLCGERTLANLTENRESCRLLTAVWGSGFLDTCLESGDWNFATRSIELTFDPDITPSFGFTYAFSKPTDWKRTTAICLDERFQSPLDYYTDEGKYWYADPSPIFVRYVSNDPINGGMDLTRWPEHFTRWVETLLAYRICKKLTNSEADDQVLFKKEKLAREAALSWDARQSAPQFNPPGRFVRARMRANSNSAPIATGTALPS